MMQHPSHTEQFAGEHRAALQHAGQRHRVAAPKRRSWWSRRPTDERAEDTFELLRIGAAIPPPGSRAFAAWASDFGQRIADEGLARCERQARTIAMLARGCRLAPESVAVVVDRTQPVVARERAIGNLLVALADDQPCAPALRATSSAA